MMITRRLFALPLLLLLTLSSPVQSAVLRFNGGTPSWNYMSRFCFRPNSPSSKSTSKIIIIRPNFVNQRAQSNMTDSDIPIYLAAYWDDPTSQNICNSRLNCYESVYAKDLWTNVYHGVPSSSESIPSCSWRLGVAEKRGNLISLSDSNLKNITTPSSHMSSIASIPGLNALNAITARELPYLGKSIREYYFALASCFPKDLCDDDNNGCEYSLTGSSILLVLENSYDNESYKHLSSDDYEVMNCCIWAVSITALLSVLALKSISAHYHYHTLHWLHASLIVVVVCLFISYGGSAKYFSDFGQFGLGKKREQAMFSLFFTKL